MAIQIAPVASSSELTDFATLPFAINRNNPLWVPPLIKQEMELLSKDRHPFWQGAKGQLFLASENGRLKGRIAAIVDNNYNSFSGEKCGAFGFFESENDPACAGALLDAASDWLAAEGMKFMRGPLNPSTNYTCGILVQGFDRAPSLMMPWNPPYYPELIERAGFYKEQDLFAYVIDRAGLALPERLQVEVARLKKETRFRLRPSSKKTLQADIRAMLDIYRQAWAGNWGFSPLSEAEADKHVEELAGILDPDFFAIFFDGEKPVAGMVGLPDMNPLLKRLNGRIGLSAPWHYWRSRKQIRSGLRIMLFGILPEYRLYGLPLLLLDYMLATARSKPDLRWVEGSWILEDNFAMNDLMEDFSGRLASRYRIYRRETSVC